MAERGGLVNPGIAYERRDLRLLPLGLVALGLLVLLGASPFIILAGFRSTAHDVDRRLTILPPAPRLQIDSRVDLEVYLRRERALLDSYGWVDRAHGIARVPIAVEMQRLAREGIPGFPQSPPPDGQAAPQGASP